MKIALTGATGFIGSAVLKKLESSDIELIPLVRKEKIHSLSCRAFEIDLDDLHSFDAKVIKGCDSLIHLAGYPNIIDDNSPNSLVEYQRLNRDVTLELGKIAVSASIKRFVLISSIKVNGESSEYDTPFTSDSDYIPDDPYAFSKYESEKVLIDIARNTGIEFVIIRPPLTYGPGVKGNFSKMVSMLKEGIPLPLGAINNKRSFVALDNLVDFIILCADRSRSSRALNEVFVISDGEDISTTELLTKIKRSYKLKAILFPMPVSILRAVAKILGKDKIADRLFGNLQIDSSKARDLLNWTPVIDMDGQLDKMAEFDQKAD